MDGTVTQVRIVARLTIDDTEAEVLEHISSYGLGKVFVERCSKRFEAERIDAVLGSLRSACGKITAAKKVAMQALEKGK